MRGRKQINEEKRKRGKIAAKRKGLVLLLGKLNINRHGEEEKDRETEKEKDKQRQTDKYKDR